MSMTIEILAERVAVLEKQMAALMDNKVSKVVEVVDAKSKKEKKPKKEASDEDKPKKKRVSGYILFSKATREEVKTDMAAAAEPDEKLKNTEIMCELARRWKALEDEGREEWNAKAKELKEAAEE